MTKELTNIQNKISKSISMLCSKVGDSSAEDRIKFLVPVINNLEESLNELKVLDCRYRLMKLELDGCVKHPEEFYMNKKQLKEESNE